MKKLTFAALLSLAVGLGCSAEKDSKGAADTAPPVDVPADSLASSDGVNTADGSFAETVSPTLDTTASSDGIHSDVDPNPSDSAAETDVAKDTASGPKQPLPTGLKGVKPPEPTALPQFSAVVDQDGKSVGPDRLVGTWSVLWFYPIASTAG